MIRKNSHRHACISSLIFILFTFINILPVTLVYNMRVRRAFNLPEGFKQKQPIILGTLLPISFFRSSEALTPLGDMGIVSEKRRVEGSLIDLRYIPSKRWWLEATTGIENDRGRFEGADREVFASRTGFDDFVVAGGYRHFIKDHTQLIGYGLVGFPTRRKVDLDDRFGPLVGTRFFNMGVGGEIAYSFINELKRSISIIGQGRIIHGFSRQWFPILPEDTEIVPGNFSDILLAFQYREKTMLFQTGYDLTIFSGQGIKFPVRRLEIDTFTRNSWYATVARGFLDGLSDNLTAVGIGCSLSRTKRFDARTFIMWAFVSQVF